MAKSLFGSGDISLSPFGKSASGGCPDGIRTRLRKTYWKGEYKGPCFCCGRQKNWDDIQMGRIKAGGKYSIKNTRIICRTCNLNMGRTNMKTYMRETYPKRYEKYFGHSTDSTVGKYHPHRKPKSTNIFGFPSGKIDLGI